MRQVEIPENMPIDEVKYDVSATAAVDTEIVEDSKAVY